TAATGAGEDALFFESPSTAKHADTIAKPSAQLPTIDRTFSPEPDPSGKMEFQTPANGAEDSMLMTDGTDHANGCGKARTLGQGENDDDSPVIAVAGKSGCVAHLRLLSHEKTVSL
ncbi:unnamed protein product, partial [Amoebophrya sp. A120]